MARERAERGDTTAPASQPAGLNIAEIRQLIALMSAGDIEEIGIEQESVGLKLILRKQTPSAAATVVEVDGEPYEPAEHADEQPRDNHIEVGAPLVGIFRTSMKPGSKPLVGVGDVVREGQVVAAIEALNVLNEVEVSIPGRVREILVTDGQPVEYGQTLVVIEP
jgi:acetyl-CoA carboxylase biotin carboxyl carrier protein